MERKKIIVAGTLALVLVSCIFAAGCTATQVQEEQEAQQFGNPTEGFTIFGTWVLKNDHNVTLDMYKDGTYGGKAQINQYSGTYSLRASETEPRGFVIFTDPIRTLMGGSPEDMDAEDAFLAAFPRIVSYTISDLELEFIDEDGNTLLTFIGK